MFTQRRNGFNNSTFRIFKFRTMGVLEDGDIIPQARRGDPRVTRFGRLLRQTSIDELPQLLNVLFGNMSLVGPRPHAVAHNNEYQKLYCQLRFPSSREAWHHRLGTGQWVPRSKPNHRCDGGAR